MTEDNITFKQKAFPYWRTKFVSYFDVGKHTIKIELSTFSGSESVYVDDKLVSKIRNSGSESMHEFEADGQRYAIQVDIKSTFFGPIDITLRRDGVDVDGDHWVFPYSRPGTILGLVCATAGVVAAVIFSSIF